jgi:hypothetical protein
MTTTARWAFEEMLRRNRTPEQVIAVQNRWLAEWRAAASYPKMLLDDMDADAVYQWSSYGDTHDYYTKMHTIRRTPKTIRLCERSGDRVVVLKLADLNQPRTAAVLGGVWRGNHHYLWGRDIHPKMRVEFDDLQVKIGEGMAERDEMEAAVARGEFPYSEAERDMIARMESVLGEKAEEKPNWREEGF